MENSGIDRRSQKRVEASVPVLIHGVDAQGVEFDESTDALDVSRRGVSVMTQHELTLFASLTVVLPGRGPSRAGEGPTDFFATATVVRVQKEEESYRVGIRFIGATLSIYTSENTH
jgi:hypothetical protein